MTNRAKIRELYMKLYHNEPALNDLFECMDKYKAERSKDLLSMDKKQRNWYFGQDIVGMTLYTDLFAGNLKKLSQKIRHLILSLPHVFQKR